MHGKSRLMSLPALVVVAVVILSLLAASASAAQPKPVAKVGPGVYLVKISAKAKGSAEPRPESEAGRVLEAKREAGPKDGRIVGGTQTTISKWPWQAALLFDAAHSNPGDSGFDRQFCGGSVVAPNAVISAAHCAFDVVDADNQFDPVFFDVVTGRTKLSSSQGQELGVSAYYAFADAQGNLLFDGDTSHGWDAILIELSSNSTAQRIRLAGPNERAAWAPGQPAFTTGWGALNEGDLVTPQVFPDDLREVQLSMTADGTCGATYGGSFIQALMVCAGVPAGGKDTCQGDSGGPLVVRIPSGEFRLVGDTSFGDGCGRPNTPGIYGRIGEGPMQDQLATAALEISGVNIVGICGEAQAALDKAKKKVKKAKKKLKKAKHGHSKPKVKKAKKKLKKAKKKLKKARRAVAADC
jgi:trypsin